MSETDSTCSICLGAFTDQNPKTTLECSHAFHATCIIDWFRSATNSNTCPLCRSEPSTVLNYPDTMARCTILRRKARAKNAPPELRRCVEKIRAAEQQLLRCKKAWRDFKTDHVKVLLQKHRTLMRRRWMAQRAVNKAKRELGLRSFPDLCAMPLARVPYSRHRMHYL